MMGARTALARPFVPAHQRCGRKRVRLESLFQVLPGFSFQRE